MKGIVATILIGVMLIAFSVVVLPLIFIAANTSRKSCETPTDIAQGVTLGTGQASEAFFSKPWLGKVEERKEIARQIIEVGRQREESDYSIETAIGTALQESKLLNLLKGDRDSLGVFQQRPSQNWGTPTEILDIRRSTAKFFDALDRVPNKDALSHKDAAIAVQIPSIEAYESWAWDEVSHDLVSGSSTQTCAEAAGAHSPLLKGYRVSSGGAFNDANYLVKPHKGIDLSGYPGGSSGKPVFAAFAGLVVASGAGNGCGGNNTVTIVHEGGFETGYMHMEGSSITVRVGDRVTAGQQIGAIGGCGDATGPHLHFEVNPAADSAPWIDKIQRVTKYGSTWLDPVAFMAHFGIELVP